MPERFPLALYLRDRPVLPADADVLAADSAGEPLVFSLRGNCLGFLGHPGMKRGMAEDIIMEFAETPENTVESLEALGAAQGDIAEALDRADGRHQHGIPAGCELRDAVHSRNRDCIFQN
jgi:GMP synthase (glutamine-hydrolysing)